MGTRKTAATLLSAALLLVGLVAPATAGPVVATDTPPPASDTIRDWNGHALAALGNSTTAPVPGAGQTPPVASLHMAMVQLAVYDAVNSIAGGFEPYLTGLPLVPRTASLDAAAATAAHHVLVGLGRDPVPPLPDVVLERLDGLYLETLDAIPDGPSKDQGIAAGAAAAEAMLAGRDGDGRYIADPFSEGTEPGDWRPTSGINDPFAWVRNVTPFTLNSASQFLSRGPRDLESPAYAREFREVKNLGSLTDSDRDEEQQALADFYTVSPVELFNRAFRGISESRGLSLAAEARFFAMVNVAGADALISCWYEKEHWSFWRPITAIQLGDDDDNPRTTGDPDWAPYLTTPPYPDHTSGYNCHTGSVMQAAQQFFGTATMEFSVQNLTTGVIREYQRFRDVYLDTIDARIYQGIHFRSADNQGAQLGIKVARWVHRNYFQRLR